MTADVDMTVGVSCRQVRSTGKIEGMVRHNDLKIEQGGVMVGDIQKGAKSSP